MSGTWFPAGLHPTRVAIARWAIDQIGVMEDAGDNRSELIDGWNTEAGAPIGSPYCTSFCFCGWNRNGAKPAGNAASQTWHINAVNSGLWVATPEIGDVAIFDFSTTPGVGDHSGIVIRADHFIMTVEANTNDNGSPQGDGVYEHQRKGRGLLGFVSLGL